MSAIRFDDRVAVVTGAGAGIGKCYALDLGKRGAKVVVNDLGGSIDGSGASSKAADLVVDEIKKAGGTAVANYDSVSSVTGGENIIKTAMDTFGRVDIIINNAGIVRDHTFTKLEEAEWDAVINVHLKGAYCVTKPAIQIMKDNNYGRIIFTASGVGLYGNFGQANYAAAKMGLVGLMNVLKLETGKYNIKYNTIAPNAATRMTENLLPPVLLEKLKPEMISPLVLFLASEQNQDTGMIFNCFGGWYSRTAIMCGSGVLIDKGPEAITPEEIMTNWGKIAGLDDLKVINNIAESFGFISSLFSKK